jgi:hypothetical protein
MMMGYYLFYIWHDSDCFIKINCFKRQIRIWKHSNGLFEDEYYKDVHDYIFKTEDDIMPTIQKFIKYLNIELNNKEKSCLPARMPQKNLCKSIVDVVNETFKKSLPFITVLTNPVIVKLPIENRHTRSCGFSIHPNGYYIFYIWYDPGYFIEINSMYNDIRFRQNYCSMYPVINSETGKTSGGSVHPLHHRFENEDEIAPTIQKFIRHMLSEQLN